MDGAPEQQPEVRDLLQAGVPLRLDLPTPCRTFVAGLQCGSTEAYITVKPFGTSHHYERRCANGHFVDNVKHAEVRLLLGIPQTTTEKRAAVRDALTPSRRVSLNVTIRDRSTCVYCGRRAGEVQLDGSVVAVGADHIIARALIDADKIRLDRELLQFAREIQLVTACRSCNAAKHAILVDLNAARELFIRHVLKDETRGANLGRVAMLERLHRIVAHGLRLDGTSSPGSASSARDEVH